MKSLILLVTALHSVVSLAAYDKVLVLGDSHSVNDNRLGPSIYKYFQGTGSDVRLIASCGARVAAYLKGGYQSKCGYWKKDHDEDIQVPWKETAPATETLVQEMKNFDFRNGLIVIQLGSNHIGDNVAAVKKQVQQLLSVRGKNGCVFIGPPHSSCHESELESLNQGLREQAELMGCKYIDSLAMTQDLPTSSDCLHFTPTSSATWGQRIIQVLRSL